MEHMEEALSLPPTEIDALGDDIAVTAAHIDAATHRLLTLIREFDRAGGWYRQGALSCAHWLSWRIGLGLGPARAFESIEAMAMSGEVDALWILTPNDTRLDIMREIHRLTKAGAPLRAIACEKPLARTLAEAREMLALVEDAGLLHGYLENQLFSTAVMRGKDIIWRRAVPQGGRPYLARAAEEHSGPHEPWFWQGERQGGGVLSDMMCHSVEVARFMLTAPGATRDSLRLMSASATTANLKWTRPRYAADLRTRMGIDFAKRPVEDFARGILAMEDADGHQLMIEATTSWAYVGAGDRKSTRLNSSHVRLSRMPSSA